MYIVPSFPFFKTFLGDVLKKADGKLISFMKMVTFKGFKPVPGPLLCKISAEPQATHCDLIKNSQ